MNDKTPSVKMPHERIQTSCDRLAKPHERGNLLPPLIARKPLTAAVMETNVNRLYKQAVEHKLQMRVLNVTSLPDLVKRVAIDNETLQTTFIRLHDGAMQARVERTIRLKQKYVQPHAPENSIGVQGVKDMANRLCTQAMENHKQRDQKLYEKYIAATEPTKVKLTKDQVKASAERLSHKK